MQYNIFINHIKQSIKNLLFRLKFYQNLLKLKNIFLSNAYSIIIVIICIFTIIDFIIHNCNKWIKIEFLELIIIINQYK